MGKEDVATVGAATSPARVASIVKYRSESAFVLLLQLADRHFADPGSDGALAQNLCENPALIEAWETWSVDQRWPPSAYLAGAEVGWFDGARRNRRSRRTRTLMAPPCVNSSRGLLAYDSGWRVWAVTCPKCQLSGLGWPRWIRVSLPGVLPDPSPLDRALRAWRRRSCACRPGQTGGASTRAGLPWWSCPRRRGGRSSGGPRCCCGVGRWP